MDTIFDAIQTIQAILAPAVMITGVALLLLTLNARHSSLVNRIRLLNDEERQLRRKAEKVDELDNARLTSIQNQVDQLLPRLRYVRNGMLCHLLAVIFFVLTSFSIGLSYFPGSSTLTQAMINSTFAIGMLLVLVGVAFLAAEIYVSYGVILIETKEEKRK